MSEGTLQWVPSAAERQFFGAKTSMGLPLVLENIERESATPQSDCFALALRARDTSQLITKLKEKLNERGWYEARVEADSMLGAPLDRGLVPIACSVTPNQEAGGSQWFS